MLFYLHSRVGADLKPGVTVGNGTFSDCFICLSEGIERMVLPQLE